MPLLTKSKYLAGLESDALLWRLVNDPGSLPPVTQQQQARFDTGHQIGDLAKQLFSGQDLSSLSFMENISATKQLIEKRCVIFEAGFKPGQLYARCDVLVPNTDGSWDIIEVKSSTKAKDIHAHDLAFQHYVANQCGLRIRNCHVLHINAQYVRQGDIDLQNLLTSSDITTQVVDLLKDVPHHIIHMMGVLDLPECPPFQPQDIARSTYGNPLIDEFMANVPDHSVFELYRISTKKAIQLWESGVQRITDVPLKQFNNKQRIQAQCTATQQPYIDIPHLTAFLDTLQFPLFHLDFETFQCAIPLYDGTRPYQQIPFQYSVHIQQKDGSTTHKEFLHTESSDPRLSFLTSLRDDIGQIGSIVVYNKSFEMTRLKELADAFPQHASWITTLMDRIVDLLEPFQQFWYYDHRQKGSCSIKQILPLFADIQYSTLAISNGEVASQSYVHYIINNEPCDDRNMLIQNLLAYCKMDTWAMVCVYNGLRSCTQTGTSIQ